MQKSLWELSLAYIYVHLSWTMKTAVVSKNHRHKSKISKYLTEQYFEKYSILTLCLNDWMSKYKNSPEYSQLIKMEEQHILEHASSLLLSLLCFYNILNVFSLFSCHLINPLQQKYPKDILHKLLSYVPANTREVFLFLSAHTFRNTNTLQSFAFIFGIQEALKGPYWFQNPLL